MNEIVAQYIGNAKLSITDKCAIENAYNKFDNKRDRIYQLSKELYEDYNKVAEEYIATVFAVWFFHEVPQKEENYNRKIFDLLSDEKLYTRIRKTEALTLGEDILLEALYTLTLIAQSSIIEILFDDYMTDILKNKSECWSIIFEILEEEFLKNTELGIFFDFESYATREGWADLTVGTVLRKSFHFEEMLPFYQSSWDDFFYHFYTLHKYWDS